MAFTNNKQAYQYKLRMADLSPKVAPVTSTMKKTDVNLKEMEEGIVVPNEKTRPFNPLVWKVMLLVGVLIYGTYTIFVHLCEVDGKIPFSSSSMVLNTEILKLCISLTMFIPEVREKGFQVPTASQALPFSVPAILYFLNNNLGVHMQLQMDPATYQVLGNLKILSTAFLYRLIIKRPITGIQWLALLLLATAGACNSYGGFRAKPGESSASVIHITLKGLIMISCYCLISGLSGVYTEYILKRKYDMSLHLQNSMLYSFGILLNIGGFFYGAYNSSDPRDLNLFHGYSLYTVFLIITQATSGLIMSAIFKHGDNITRLFLISCAMLVTTVLSMIIFNLQLNIFFCISFLLVILALALYHKT